MCDSDGRWSTETVELVARAWYQSETPHYPLPGTLSSTGRRYRAQARMVLAALADAGLLMPPVGGERAVNE